MSAGNDPAYPLIGAAGLDEDCPGLTKREAFAMSAMQGYCAHRDIGNSSYALIAQQSVCQAEALLVELAKEGGK